MGVSYAQASPLTERRPFFPRVSAPTPQPEVMMTLIDRMHQTSYLPSTSPKPYVKTSSLLSSLESSPRQRARSPSPTNSDIPPRFLDSPHSSSYKDEERLPASPSPSPSRTRVARAYNRNQSVYSDGSSNDNRSGRGAGIPPPITQSMLMASALPTRSQAHPESYSASPPRSRIRFSERSASPLKSRSQGHSIYTYSQAPRIRQPSSFITGILREEKAIQKNVQALLDAQAAGLAKGSSGTSDEVSSEGGSATPTSRSQYIMSSQTMNGMTIPSGVVPVRQPKPKPTSLKAARRGISNALRDLETLKAQQLEVVKDSLSHIAMVQERLTAWTNSTQGFKSEIANINAGAGSREIDDLVTERSAVQHEIRDLEDRLLALRAKESHFSRNITELQNKKSSTLSSFVEGRKAVESDIARFLQRPGIELEEAASLALYFPARNGSDNGLDAAGDDDAIFLDLPPKRRTLDMATSFLSSNTKSLNNTLRAAAEERDALKEGQELWSSTLAVVHTFEDEMRAEMKSGSAGSGVDMLKKQVIKMDGVLHDLQVRFHSAELKQWNLLVCAIGAELEAFKEGRALLASVLKQLDPGALKDEVESDVANAADPHMKQEDSNGLDEMVDTYRTAEEHPKDGLVDAGPPAKAATPPYHGESEDDGPHPDLLTEVDGED